MHGKRVTHIGEFGLIELVQRRVGISPSAIRGIGDDAAVLPLSSTRYLLLTTDMMVQGVHFTPETPADQVGYKAMAVNISDIAAMGGVPKHAVVSLGVPGDCPAAFVLAMYKGMRRAADKFGVAIVGGDTVRSRQVVVNIALTGEAKKEHVVYRSGARVGDQIFVTGRLGGSLASGRHLNFMPRLAQAQYLVTRFKPSAMIDLSDGLAGDLGHILRQSKVGAVIKTDRVPLHKGVGLQGALYDGEDFELLFTLNPPLAKKLRGLKRPPFPFTWIGEINPPTQGLKVRDPDGKERKILGQGYTHF